MPPLYHLEEGDLLPSSPHAAWPPKPARLVTCQPAQPEAFRYVLDVVLADGPTLLVIQKNPSRADAMQSDPTVRAVERWAVSHGFGRVLFANLFAWRSPHPAALNGCTWLDAVGPENNTWLLQTATSLSGPQDRCVAAWGNPNGINPARYTQRIADVLELLRTIPLWRVGTLTQHGQPRHGLWWPIGGAMQPLQPPPHSAGGARTSPLPCTIASTLDTLAPCVSSSPVSPALPEAI